MARTPKAQYRAKAQEREDSLNPYAPTANRGAQAFGLLDQFTLEEAFITSGTAARIVMAVPEEMFRSGFDIEVPSSVDFDDKAFRSRWDTLNATSILVEAFVWSRLYGGGAVMIGTNVVGDEITPLRPGEVVDFLRAVACTEMKAYPGYEYRFDPDEFGMPEVWGLDPLYGGTDIPVNNQRLLKIKGRPMPTQLRKNAATSQRYFGLSALQGVLCDIKDYDECHRWATLLLQRLQQLVYKTEGAGDQCETRAGANALQRKVDFADGTRSAKSTIAIDKDTDEIALLNGSLSGVKDVLDTKKARITQSSGLPQIVLTGDASGGMNNSAEGAMQSWQNYIAREQENKGTPVVSALVTLMYPDLKEFSVKWKPLAEETPSQMADRLYKESQADNAYADNILTVDEVRATLKKRGDYVMGSTPPHPPQNYTPTAADANPGTTNV